MSFPESPEDRTHVRDIAVNDREFSSMETQQLTCSISGKLTRFDYANSWKTEYFGNITLHVTIPPQFTLTRCGDIMPLLGRCSRSDLRFWGDPLPGVYAIVFPAAKSCLTYEEQLRGLVHAKLQPVPMPLLIVACVLLLRAYDFSHPFADQFIRGARDDCAVLLKHLQIHVDQDTAASGSENRWMAGMKRLN